MTNFTGYPSFTYPYQTTTAAPQQYYQQKPWQIPYQETQTLTQQQLQNQQFQNSMIWVQGEAGAKAYIVPNGTTVPLWDSENQVIYIKSVDASGKPTMTILDYNERVSSDYKKEETHIVDYATKEQFISLENQYSSFSEKIDEINKHIAQIEDKISRPRNKPHNNNQNRKGDQ